jgi:hypothetical protein
MRPGQLFLPFLDLVHVALLLAHLIPLGSTRPLLCECSDILQSPALLVRGGYHRMSGVRYTLGVSLDTRPQRFQIAAFLQHRDELRRDFACVFS